MLDHSRQSRSVLPGPFAHIIDQRAHSGIGKTMFLHYMTWRLRQIPSVTRIILERVRWDFLDLAREQVLSRAGLPRAAPSTSQWVLFDSTTEGPPIGLWPAVLVTSPKCGVQPSALRSASLTLTTPDYLSGNSSTSKKTPGNLSCRCGATANCKPATECASPMCPSLRLTRISIDGSV